VAAEEVGITGKPWKNHQEKHGKMVTSPKKMLIVSMFFYCVQDGNLVVG
jgi:hypothetical protein